MSQTISERLEYLRQTSGGTLGEPDASKRCMSGSAGRGWCSWAIKTRPLTRQGAQVVRPRQPSGTRDAERLSGAGSHLPPSGDKIDRWRAK
jgi:hypothetical protein